MIKSVYKILKMDCPSEEKLIRMQLEEIDGIKNLEFDIQNRMLTIIHKNKGDDITQQLDRLNLDSTLIETSVYDENTITENASANRNEKKVLLVVLIINAVFFVIEMTFGWISKSMGLAADSLDMFADASVYGLSLYAVGKAVARKKNIAKLSGYIQLGLAVLGFMEVLRRFLGFEELPDYKTMMIVAGFAFVANIICLYLLQKHKSNEAHMKASMIFTSNDIVVNLGVIVAGFLVNVLSSNKPDLIIGSIVFIVVARGAFRILKIAK
ncbi:MULTISPECIES: cation transporter [Melioribacter]|nr:cation transporter [Melioribacter roseus]